MCIIKLNSYQQLIGIKNSSASSSATSSSSSSSSTSTAVAVGSTSASSVVRPMKHRTVTILYIDVHDTTQLPTSPIHVHDMKDLRNYVENVPFAEMTENKFASMIKLNGTFGESFANNGYFIYCLKKLYCKTLYPSAFHSDNYPNSDARIALCKSKYIIVSPSCRDESERISHYSSVTKDGVIILNDESPPVSPVRSGLKRKLDNVDFTSDPLSE
jgi:hypothetical protein